MSTPPPGNYPPPPSGNYPPPPPGNYPSGGYPPPPPGQPGTPPGGYYPSGGYPPPPTGYPPTGQPAPPGLAGPTTDAGPAPVRRSRPGCLSMSLGGVALIALVGAVIWFGFFGRSTNHAVAGDCVNATATQAIKVDCGAPNATFKVRVVTQGSSFGWRCADPGTMVKVTQRIRTGKYYRYCLALNAAQGDCFTGSVSPPSSNVHKVVCGTKGAYKVTKVFDKGSASLCGGSGPGTAEFWYANPANTYCLQKTGT